MKISCVVDNQAGFRSIFHAEHGFSVLIENQNTKILFDFGKTPGLLKHNLNLLNGFNDLKYAVLSHGHYDHAGGLPAILNKDDISIIMHENALIPKYVIEGAESQFTGFELGEDERSKCNFIQETTKISRDIWIFNQITRIIRF